jgi:hypothetical protein
VDIKFTSPSIAITMTIIITSTVIRGIRAQLRIQARIRNLPQVLARPRSLIIPQTLGSATIVKATSTEVSQIIGICGGAVSSTPSLTAGELLANNPDGVLLQETIVDWPSANDAAQIIVNDTNAVSQSSAGCSYSNGGTEAFTEDSSGSAPQGCGQYLATNAEVGTASYFGSRVETQCGTFTIEIDYEAEVPPFNSAGIADGYLNNAVGRLMTSLRTG